MVLLSLFIYSCFLLALIVGLNGYLFRSLSLSLKPILLILRIALLKRMLPSMEFAAAVSVALVLTGIATVLFIQSLRYRILSFRNRNRNSQGSARWATIKELKKAKTTLAEPKGIILGALDKRKPKLIFENSHYHTLICGATGSGKGVGIIIPTLFTWKESVFVIDPKGESYDITGGYRSSFSNVYYFNPRSEKTCSINPLDFIPRTVAAMGEISGLCMSMHPDKGKEPYWDQSARMLLEMMIGHVFVKGERKTLPEAADLLLSAVSPEALFQTIIDLHEENPLEEGDPLKAVEIRVVSNARHFLNMAQGADSDQINTHMNSLRIDLNPYSDPVSRKAFGPTSFPIADILDGKRPISVFFCLSVAEIQNSMTLFKNLISVILKWILSGPRKHQNRLLMILDEFSQFKRFEVVEEQIPFVRGYGIRFMAIIQSLGQLQQHYGIEGTKALLDNFELKVLMKASDVDTCAWFERLLGKQTIVMKKTSLSFNRRKQGVENWTESANEVGRSLMDTEEILQMDREEELLFIPFLYPYRARKVKYYSDQRFKNLVGLEIQEPELPLLLEYKVPEFEQKASEPVSATEEMRSTGFSVEEEIEEKSELKELQNIFSELRNIGLEEKKEEAKEDIDEEETEEAGREDSGERNPGDYV